MVHPYRKETNLVMTDAFRGPMASAFKLHLEDIMLFTDAQRCVLDPEEFSPCKFVIQTNHPHAM